MATTTVTVMVTRLQRDPLAKKPKRDQKSVTSRSLLPHRSAKTSLGATNIAAFSVQEAMCLDGDIAVIFPEQKGVGVTVSLRAQHHRGSVERHRKVRIERHVVVDIKVCVQVTKRLQWEITKLSTS